jgi:uncharacterized protein with HEPN domain
MRLEAKKCLYDIQQAADLLAQFTASKTFSNYKREPMLRLAVERGLTIIGEALSKLAKFDPTLAARISEHRSIIAFRNILIHAYAEVDDRLVWDIVETELPTLRREAAELLREGEETPG